MGEREMWAPKNWRESPGMVAFSGWPEPLWSDDVRVLVQEIPEGRPSFKVGDRVTTPVGSTFTVDGDPYPSLKHGTWKVPVASAGGHIYVYEACDITLLPTERPDEISVDRVCPGGTE